MNRGKWPLAPYVEERCGSALVVRGRRGFARFVAPGLVRTVAGGLAGLVLATGCALASPDRSTDAPSPARTVVPGARVPAPTTPTDPAGCSGPTTPQMLSNEGMEDTRAEAKDFPRLRHASDIAWQRRTGRFLVELANPTCATWHDTQLSFYLGGVSRDPSGVRLEYASPAGWLRIPVAWVDPEEPEEIASGPLKVDFRAGERKAYEFRLTLPRPPAVPTDLTGIEARLDAPGEHAYEWASTLRVESRTPQQVSVAAPASITPGGPPAVFTVKVHNGGDLGPDAQVRLLLVTSSATSRAVADENAAFEQFRDGGWRPLDARSPGTPAFSLPPGASRSFRFRVTLGRHGHGGGDPIDLGAQLLRAAGAPRTRLLAWGTRPVSLRMPRISAVVPARPPKVGETAEFVVTVTNRSGVDYSGLVLRIDIYGRRFVDRYSYRVGATGAWHPLRVPANPQMPDLILPPSGVLDAPDGFEQTYALRLAIGRRPTEAMNYFVHLADPANDVSVGSIEGTLR